MCVGRILIVNVWGCFTQFIASLVLQLNPAAAAQRSQTGEGAWDSVQNE